MRPGMLNYRATPCFRLRNLSYSDRLKHFAYMKLLLSFLCTILSVFSGLADFRAGIAIRNVTPDPLLPVVGGIGPGSKVTRKEGDLTVRALVFEEGTNRVAI